MYDFAYVVLEQGYFRNVSCTLSKISYTITDFCRSEYEFLLTCKLILTEAEG